MKSACWTFLVLTLLLCNAGVSHAQVVVEWGVTPKKLLSYPHTISERVNVNIVVQNVNDLLYSYDINLKGTPRAINDAMNLFPGLTKGLPEEKPIRSCNDAIEGLTGLAQGINTAVQRIFDPMSEDKLDNAKKPKSIPIGETIADWNKYVRPDAQKIEGSVVVVQNLCKEQADQVKSAAAISQARTVSAQVALYQVKIDGPHEVTKNVTLEPDTDYEVSVIEKAGSVVTAMFSASFSPSSHVFTLSLGALITQISQRSYSSVKDATDPAKNLLNVNGTGRWTPLGVALLNYRLPKLQSTGDTAGLSLSSGFVLRFGGSESEASSLGWFGGPSLHLFHRLFLTAGAHVGEFADFPQGLAHGKRIPDSFGNLTPTKRWTTRFAFAITYATKAFGTTAAKPKEMETKTETKTETKAPLKTP